MAKNNSVKRIVAWVSVIVLLLTLGGILWAAASQNQRLETTCVEQTNIRTKVNKNEKDIVELKTDVKYIRKGIDRIEKKL